MATIRRPIVFDKRYAKITSTDSDFQPNRDYNDNHYNYLNQREGIHGLREMTLVEYNEFKDWWRYLYAGDPTVELTHVASGGNLGSMTDLRYDVGDMRTSVSTLFGHGSLDDPQLITQGTFSSINQTVDTTVTEPAHLPPMLGWAAGAGKIQKMSVDQFYSTMSNELGKLVTQNGSGMGGYLIHDATSPVLNADSGDTTSLGLVYTDTYQTLHSGNLSGGAKADTPITGDSYYLHRCNSRSFDKFSFPRPVYMDGNSIREYSYQALFDYHQDLMQYMAVYGRPDDGTGAIRYYISTDASGAGVVSLGTGMADRYRADTNTVLTYTDNVDIYRSQEVPGGTNAIRKTYSLRGTRST